jgi:hypothetical protein
MRLESELEDRLGTFLGYDFGSVRIHAGADSDRLCRALMARAFTVGSDVFFAERAYDPECQTGLELIAHELVHVVQQNGANIMGSSDEFVVRAACDALEREAHSFSGVAASVARGAKPVAALSFRASWRGGIRMEIQRSLASQALTSVPPIGIPLTCHVAVWYWAAQEAQALGLTGRKAPQKTLQNIAALPVGGGPQAAMMALPRSGLWDFAMIPSTPPAGTVLLWTGGATHVAVVTGNNTIRGYNQVVQFNPAIVSTNLTSGRVNELAPAQRVVHTITEATIVNAAGAFGL